MIFIIGGYAQGKLDYVKKAYRVRDENVYSGYMPELTNDHALSDSVVSSDKTVSPEGAALTDEAVSPDSVAPSDGIVSEDMIVVAEFNRIAEHNIKQGIDTMEIVEQLINNYSNCIIISDEIGNGIVPMEQEERMLREEIGRLQIQIAKQADEVVRVICGLGQRIK